MISFLLNVAGTYILLYVMLWHNCVISQYKQHFAPSWSQTHSFGVPPLMIGAPMLCRHWQLLLIFFLTRLRSLSWSIISTYELFYPVGIECRSSGVAAAECKVSVICIASESNFSKVPTKSKLCLCRYSSHLSQNHDNEADKSDLCACANMENGSIWISVLLS